MDVDIAGSGENLAYPSAKFVALEGKPAREFALRARLADLIVINRSFGKEDASYGMVETALFRTGRPVLLMPVTLPERSLQEKVMIAWNGSFEASRAVHLALPFIKGAQVRIFTGIEDEALPLSANDLVTYLQRQGISADVVTPSLTNETREEALKKAISDFGAGLLVMGAFSREDRLRETLLGSFTEEMLENAEIPLLMAN
jgi:nucleotide-binding universal stress UspA family protein